MAKKKETAEQEQFRLEEAFDRIEALLGHNLRGKVSCER